MSGETLDFKNNVCLQLEHYCQVHEEEIPRNSQAPRTKGGIFLIPSGNLQGIYKFMALESGKNIVQNNWDLTTMPDMVIARVNTLGGDQPKLLTFTGRHGRLIRNLENPGVGDDSDEGEV